MTSLKYVYNRFLIYSIIIYSATFCISHAFSKSPFINLPAKPIFSLESFNTPKPHVLPPQNSSPPQKVDMIYSSSGYVPSPILCEFKNFRKPKLAQKTLQTEPNSQASHSQELFIVHEPRLTTSMAALVAAVTFVIFII
ncbi:hypothetical protein BB559_001165 [Furculomyces boomerangus]|uniref:Uncharacterized protein n=2 Tax=Harpellales TaxID=61421 RepID=A0A2T9Z2Y4_9FUNG|nr:hypothetical protein BB559_001165 [Furculomyces boomerangus]PVZ98408.1 hypothetical protein BB558_005596 [Smittium angustum]